ncbi:hypothetical protein DAKH74_041760 [Maudiozyma humilis]|uniref:Required for respiratory growth protein 8, mitochondrial n=1 Tax=Maudiozyma humilis TaxID=51915 RepID=A0AAV5S1L8_MAUHU|nr:hypothetical protein DAKH74_041760 [Kazachstania humilis]
MDKTRSILQSLRLRIPSRSGRSRARPAPPARTSPLFTHFERWAGQKRRLFLQNNAAVQKLARAPLCLASNPFAQLLASPARLDRLSGLRLPRALTVQVRSRAAEPLRAALATQFSNAPDDRHSYVLNSALAIARRARSARAVLPLHVLGDAAEQPQLGGKGKKGKESEDPLRVAEYGAAARDALWALLCAHSGSGSAAGVVSGSRVRVVSDSQMATRIQVEAQGDAQESARQYVVTVNLADLQDRRVHEFLAARPNGELVLDVMDERSASLVIGVLRACAFLS